MKQLDRLIEIIKDAAKGRYSNEVMDLAAPNVEEPVRTIAEAMGLMMVKVEAREFHIEMLIKQLEEMNQKIRRNTIATVSAMANALAARDRFIALVTGGGEENLRLLREGKVSLALSHAPDEITLGV